MEHYERIEVVEYLEKLSKNENCILLNGENLQICNDYLKADFIGDVLVYYRDYTRHFWFRYSFDGNNCTEVKYNLSDRITKLQEEILYNWEEIVAGIYVRRMK